MFKKILFGILAISFLFISCDDDDDEPKTLVPGVITGGPFSFIVDGTPDMVSGITLNASTATGDNATFVITDDAGNILGLPPTLTAVEGVDFDGAGAGVCLITYTASSTNINTDGVTCDGSGNLEVTYTVTNDCNDDTFDKICMIPVFMVDVENSFDCPVVDPLECSEAIALTPGDLVSLVFETKYLSGFFFLFNSFFEYFVSNHMYLFLIS